MNQSIILLILKALEGRGAERMVTTLAQAYLEMGYQVHILCLENTQDMPLDSRVKYHVVPYYQNHDQNCLQNSESKQKQAEAYQKLLNA